MWRTIARASLILALSGCAPQPKQATGTVPEAPPPRATEAWTLEEYRDSAFSMVLGTIATGDTSVHVRVEPTKFRYWYAPDSAAGYAIHALVTRDSTSCLLGEMERALASRGWSMHHGYTADGPDGSAMGFVKGPYLCVVQGSWDGGDDSDPTYEPEIGCEMIVTCVPRREDDQPE